MFTIQVTIRLIIRASLRIPVHFQYFFVSGTTLYLVGHSLRQPVVLSQIINLNTYPLWICFKVSAQQFVVLISEWLWLRYLDKQQISRCYVKRVSLSWLWHLWVLCRRCAARTQRWRKIWRFWSLQMIFRRADWIF